MRLAVSMMAIFLFVPLPAAAQSPPPGWIADSRTGCRVWNAMPSPNESITWSGSCRDGLQWFSNGRPADREEADFRDGKKEGLGIILFANGDRFHGEYRDGERDGHGIYTWPNGDRYDGEYRAGEKDGQGTMTYADGTLYEGAWHGGKPHGQGKATWPNGQVYDGVWTDGCFKQGKLRASLYRTLSSCP
jgi:hypothetical protein